MTARLGDRRLPEKLRRLATPRSPASASPGAGPVRDGVVQLTNLDWRIDRSVLARVLTAEKSAVLNDLQAQGHAIGHIAPENLIASCPSPPIRPMPRSWWWVSAPASTPARSSRPRRAASCRRPRRATWRCPSRSRACRDPDRDRRQPRIPLRRGGPVGPRRQHAARRASRDRRRPRRHPRGMDQRATPRRSRRGGFSCRSWGM
jgi:hypothetical protein